jgi:putative transposase
MRMTEQSEVTGKPYPLVLVLEAAGLSSAGWYRRSVGLPAGSAPQGRRGPKPLVPDTELLEAIREDLSGSHFHSEGHKKVLARLRRKGLKIGRKRVLRLMRDNGLLAPVRSKADGSSRKHDGVIRTERPNQMWGTDGKQFWTRDDGMCWFFGVVDHCTDEILAHHEAKYGSRFAALEPVKEAIKREIGALGKDIAKGTGLALRRDHGTQYDSHDFQREVKYLGLTQSPAFVRSPECNGIIERFHRILQEQVFDVYGFENLAEARRVISEFIEHYNREWLIGRHGYQSPREYRSQLAQNYFLKSA